jgi:hypothetical protein
MAEGAGLDQTRNNKTILTRRLPNETARHNQPQLLGNNRVKIPALLNDHSRK